MNYYKLIIAYDGTEYNGWHIQKNVPTILGYLHQSYRQLFRMPISIRGASRTDSGVHALNQVVAIGTELDLKSQAMRDSWNAILSPNIVIRKIMSTDYYFIPWRNVRQKTYYYHFFLQRPLPYWNRYSWYFPKSIDIEKLQDCLQVFVGSHDFRSFSTGDDRGSDTVRTIHQASVIKVSRFGCYRIVVKGVSFLRHMVRRIVGASLFVASKKGMPVSYLNDVLQEKNPRQVLPNAPSKGLLLYNIVYHKGGK